MRVAVFDALERTAWGAFALSAAAVILGLAVPPLPLARRRAWRLALVALAAWIVVLAVFFGFAYGPGLLGHLGLWFAASAGMLLNGPLRRAESALTRWTDHWLNR